MGIDVLLVAILPVILKGIAAAVEAYNQGKIDTAQLKTQVESALDDGKKIAADLMADFSPSHVDAFVEKLRSHATP